MNRMIRWLEKNVDKSSKMIDLGCGNGMMSIELYEAGFHHVDGVDYSGHAIELAKKLAVDSGINDLNFYECDILSSSPKEESLKNYKVCLDKGTYDAISLCKDEASSMRQRYRSAVNSMLEPGGIFFITSCNWTEAELKAFFANSSDSTTSSFKVRAVLPTPQFQFGGLKGNNVTSIVFEKNP